MHWRKEKLHVTVIISLPIHTCEWGEIMVKLKDIYDEHTGSKPYIKIATEKTRRVSTPIRTKKKESQERYAGLIKLNTATTENEIKMKKLMESYGWHRYSICATLLQVKISDNQKHVGQFHCSLCHLLLVRECFRHCHWYGNRELGTRI